MSVPPSGTVTFLFTDIEGSTRLAQVNPVAWEVARARHHAIVRAACDACHGYIFQIAGDAFCVAFAQASDALQAALQAQRGLRDEAWGVTPIRVRMGIHSGPAYWRDGEYEGYLTLARAQRIMSAGHGGQALLSLVSAELVRSDLPAGVSLRELGEHRLKSLNQPESLFQLVALDLPADFPPLSGVQARNNNLPTQLTSFIGREREISEVVRLLEGTRLLTLTGSGGTGKTRLSLEVAAQVMDDFRDGVWFVELAPLADPILVPQTVANVLGVREQPGNSMQQTLNQYLSDRQMLIVLDNCEHLVAACASLADDLLRAAPRIRILASSREALGIAGESSYHVPSLEIPNPKNQIPYEQLRDYAAVRLFVERARAAKSGFVLSEANAAAVAQICTRLDGIPLAIELAAARITVFTPEQIAARLDDRFRLLTGGSRTALPRQQTLRALIDWSYTLLSELERVLLRRLSVFAGGWTFEAAEAVCAGDGIEVVEILDLLTHLVDKSLVILDESADEPRYRMLETVRQYARERLSNVDENERLRTHHLMYFGQLVDTFEAQFFGPKQSTWLARLENDLDNLRTAFEWSLASPNGEDCLRLANALYWFWQQRHTIEGIDVYQRALSRTQNAGPSLERARAMRGKGELVLIQGDLSEAHSLLEAAMRLANELGNEPLIASTLGELASLAHHRGDTDTARRLYEETIDKFRSLNDQVNLAMSIYTFGGMAHDNNDLEQAESLYEESIALLRLVGEKAGLAVPLRRLGQVSTLRGEYRKAYELISESFTLNSDIGDRRGMAACLVALNELVIAHGRHANAVRLCAAVEKQLQELHTRLLRIDRGSFARQMTLLRDTLSTDAFDAAWAEGRALTLEQAVALALASP